MKPLLESAPLTQEDYELWWRIVGRVPHRVFWLYRDADRRDAYLMLMLGYVVPLGPGPRARVLDTLTVEELLTVFSEDRGKVYVPEATYPTSHKRQ